MFPGCQEPRCCADGKRLGLARCRDQATRTHRLPVPTPAPAPPYPGETEPTAAPPQGTKGVDSESSSRKVFTNLALDSDTAAQSGDTVVTVVTAPLARGTNDFPHAALHLVVPLASQESVNPLLSWEPALGGRRMLSSPGEVQSPPSQPLLCHSPLLHGAFWLLFRSTLPSLSARFTLPRHLRILALMSR